MSLHCLVYVSIATRKMSDNDLQTLLEKARKKNEGSAITGMLLYRDGFFAQVLEGELKDIEDLFAIISRDERHRIVFLLYTKPIEKRNFANWTMGFNKSHNDNTEAIDEDPDIFERLPPDLFVLVASELDLLMNTFKH
ncbi:MAG: BLUF domain-containing protein [Methylococcaceae bacterium]|nr:BLUF domain-containing protein [Methylococcaceae bacterium]